MAGKLFRVRFEPHGERVFNGFEMVDRYRYVARPAYEDRHHGTVIETSMFHAELIRAMQAGGWVYLPEYDETEAGLAQQEMRVNWYADTQPQPGSLAELPWERAHGPR